MPTITPNLWFDTQAEEAVAFYLSIFPDSEVRNVVHYTEAGGHGVPGTVMFVEFVLDGQPFVAINGGPQFTFDEAVSFQITCQDQAEVDRYWAALTADGGQESMCGWLKDRFGLSWQVVPVGLEDVLRAEDPDAARRAMEAMFGMRKLDLAALQAAAAGAGA